MDMECILSINKNMMRRCQALSGVVRLVFEQVKDKSMSHETQTSLVFG